MSDVMLVVLPGDQIGRGPRILAAQDGFWRVLPPAEDSPTKALLDWRLEVDQRLYKVMGDIDKNPAAHVNVSLQTAGNTVARMLLSRQLREILSQAASGPAGAEPNRLFVQMDKSLDWIPWEILYDTENGTFLSSQFLVVRLPILGWSLDSTNQSLSAGNLMPVNRVFHVMGKGLALKPARQQDWDQTFSSLPGVANQPHSFPPAANSAVFPGLQEVLDEANHGNPGIIHFTCHGGIEGDKGTTYWTLDPTTAQPTEYRIEEVNMSYVCNSLKIHKSHPLVFGNACASAAANPSGQGSLQQGFGTSFITAGASNFIGTFAPVSADVAIRFARTFYKFLLGDGLSVGHALSNAKQQFVAENDPSAKFYCLYGPPGTRYQLA